MRLVASGPKTIRTLTVSQCLIIFLPGGLHPGYSPVSLAPGEAALHNPCEACDVAVAHKPFGQGLAFVVRDTSFIASDRAPWSARSIELDLLPVILGRHRALFGSAPRHETEF